MFGFNVEFLTLSNSGGLASGNWVRQIQQVIFLMKLFRSNGLSCVARDKCVTLFVPPKLRDIIDPIKLPPGCIHASIEDDIKVMRFL